MDCELTNREQSNERIKLTCINKKITGYIKNNAIPKVIRIPQLVPFGDGIQGGHFEVIDLPNDKNFTLKQFLQPKKDLQVQIWLKKKKIPKEFFSKSDNLSLQLDQDTFIYKDSISTEKAVTPSPINQRYLCSWTEKPSLIQSTHINSEAICKGLVFCVDLQKGGSFQTTSFCFAKSAGGTNCDDATHCANANDISEIDVQKSIDSSIKQTPQDSAMSSLGTK